MAGINGNAKTSSSISLRIPGTAPSRTSYVQTILHAGRPACPPLSTSTTPHRAACPRHARPLNVSQTKAAITRDAVVCLRSITRYVTRARVWCVSLSNGPAPVLFQCYAELGHYTGKELDRSTQGIADFRVGRRLRFVRT
jgi:hypothetical protein